MADNKTVYGNTAILVGAPEEGLGRRGEAVLTPVDTRLRGSLD
jgi:hypothetical protein